MPYEASAQRISGLRLSAETETYRRWAAPVGVATRFVKGLDSFDFSYQPSIDKKQIQTLASCHFIEHGENVVFLGPPGVGKSHLAIGLGLKAIERGYACCSRPRPA